MPAYTQTDRPLRVDTVLGEDVLLLTGFRGSEAVSEPYAFELDLFSEDASIDAEKLLRSPVAITISLPGEDERTLHGLVSRFTQLSRHAGLTSYRAEVVPWLWFLSVSRDCRVFQDLSVLDIVEEVFRSQGYSDFEMRCGSSYDKREYCVQYRETHLEFVSRLLEEEGIFYFFEHSDAKHVLVLADHNGAVQPCPGPVTARMAAEAEPGEDVVTAFYQEHFAHVGVVTLKDYDPLQPSLTLESTISGDPGEEVYDYHPGRFTSVDEGDRQVRLQLEAEEAVRLTVRGAGTCRAFHAGCSFELTDHYRPDMNRKYTLLRVRHVAAAGDYRSWSSAPFDYKNDFLAVPSDVPYKPLRKTPRPVVRGSQTALVVGPAGEKIWVDKHGRIKVQFYWDRLGGHDEASSLWVRVSQNWAGNNWGGMFIPHVGHEVVVDFLEGDPDCPIVVGRVYNANNPPPQALPSNMHKSIIEDDYGNEIVFDATPGDEHIRIHSPHHSSTFVLGRSTDTKTASESTITTADNKYELKGGDFFELGVGIEASANMGIKGSLFAGASLDISLATKFALSAGVSASFDFGGKYEYSRGWKYSNSSGTSLETADDGMVKSSKKHIRLDSQQHVKLIGGPNMESLLIGEKKELRLQYGFGVRNDSDTHRREVRNAMIASAIGGVLASGGATAVSIGAMAAAKKAEADEKAEEGELAPLDAGGLALLLTAGTAGLLVGIVMAAVNGVDTNKEKPKVNEKHQFVDSEVVLDKKGVLLTNFDGTQVALEKSELQLLAKQKVFVASQASEVAISGATGVKVNAKGKVTIDGQLINIG